MRPKAQLRAWLYSLLYSLCARSTLDYQITSPLSERCDWLVAPDQTDHSPGDFVLYWMHNAIRGHENPALNLAMQLAYQNGLPLLVYHGLSEKYPFASDRHHAFILQAARDVQREFAEMGVPYAFHLERAGHRGPHLRDLTRRAAVLVTESMPVAPLVAWTERLKALVKTPIVSVDTTCILPIGVAARLANDESLPKATVCQASRYRELTANEYSDRSGLDYETLCGDQSLDANELVPLNIDSIDLGFEPVDLQNACLSELIGHCKIDHSVAPVTDSPGGTRAGYERWQRFRSEGLDQYAKRRNDSADWLGGSRLSAYLHYGMVSPFRIAREVASNGDSPGAAKFLDEFLIWREMSFHFCDLHSEELDTLEAIPDWAVEQFRKHGDDPRDETFDWESLARGKTDQPLWNAAQRSLLKHGELHNNLRMTWGKAFLPMTECPQQALNHCIDLNHRYALDGRSAASYGGILWCFGQFDHPHDSPQDIFGRVRTRPIDTHQRRLDVKRFERRCDRPIAKHLPRIGVIGAGLGGLIAARTLTDHGLHVEVFDKSRGVGGRLSTRRNKDGPSFDHGAQYFTVRDDRFARYVRSWIASGVVAPWMRSIVELHDGEVVTEKRGTPRYVGVPAMNSIGKHLAKDLSVSLGSHVQAIVRDDDADQWQLIDQDGSSLGHFDVVIANCPPEQAAPLLSPHTNLAETICRVSMKPCWALMLSCDGIDDLDYAGAFINDAPLSWIARNDAKPQRSAGQSSEPSHEESSDWVLHASADWTQEHLEDDAETVAAAMIAGFEKAIGRGLGTIHHQVAHRWRYANTAAPLPQSCLWDRATLLGACGDWCGGPRVEGAFLSGAAMAGTVLRHVTIDRSPAEGYAPPQQETLF